MKNRIRMRRGDSFSDVLVVLSGIVMLVVILAPWGYLVSPDNATRTMQAEGWTNVSVLSSSVWAPHWVGGCDKTDSVGFLVDGKNAAQQSSRATVCCGLIFKGCTIRH